MTPPQSQIPDKSPQNSPSPLLGEEDLLQDALDALGLREALAAAAAGDDERRRQLQGLGVGPGHLLLHGVVAEAPRRLEGVPVLQHLPLGRLAKVLDLVHVHCEGGNLGSVRRGPGIVLLWYAQIGNVPKWRPKGSQNVAQKILKMAPKASSKWHPKHPQNGAQLFLKCI